MCARARRGREGTVSTHFLRRSLASRCLLSGMLQTWEFGACMALNEPAGSQVERRAESEIENWLL